MKRIAPVITIDGPSGVGKGTLCKAMAKSLQWNILDSGAMYRVLAFAVLNHHINITSKDMIIALATYLKVNFVYSKGGLEVILEGENVSNKIRTEKVANVASLLAELSHVRKILLRRQRAFRKFPGLIADGRDMGTIVFPDASAKIFLDASIERRANRRMLQLQEKGYSVSFDHLLSEIKQRDDRDRNRSVSPLIPDKNALVLDSTSLSIEKLIETALQYAHRHLSLCSNKFVYSS